MTAPARRPTTNPSGITLVEVLIALSVLAIGILAISRLFPAATRTQVQDRMRVEASQYAHEQIEQLGDVDWSDATLSIGRHPAGVAMDTLAPARSLFRYYVVDTLPSPLTNLKTVTVNVTWKHLKPCTLRTTTYFRKP